MFVVRLCLSLRGFAPVSTTTANWVLDNSLSDGDSCSIWDRVMLIEHFKMLAWGMMSVSNRLRMQAGINCLGN